MIRLLRAGMYLLLCVVVLAVVGECASYVANYRAAARAQSLLQDVRSLKLGSTTAAQVYTLVGQYGGNAGQRLGYEECQSDSPRWKTYSVDVQNKLLNRIGEHDLLHDTDFRQFGATQWRVDAYFGIDSQGRLSCVAFRLSSDPIHHSSLRLDAYSSQPYSAADRESYAVGYSDVHQVQSLWASATTNAAPEHMQHLFDFDLRCLTRIGGCRMACEVMPTAWLDYQRDARERNLPLPPGQFADPRCQRLR
jgi:hypothetical protein